MPTYSETSCNGIKEVRHKSAFLSLDIFLIHVFQLPECPAVAKVVHTPLDSSQNREDYLA